MTVGHATVMGTATFFGPPRTAPKVAREAGVVLSDEEKAKAAARAVEVARTPLKDAFDDAACASLTRGVVRRLVRLLPDSLVSIRITSGAPCAANPTAPGRAAAGPGMRG